MAYFFGEIESRKLEGSNLTLILDSETINLDLADLDGRVTLQECLQDIDTASAVIGHYDTPYNFRLVLLKGNPSSVARTIGRHSFKKNPYKYSSGKEAPFGYRIIKKYLSGTSKELRGKH